MKYAITLFDNFQDIPSERGQRGVFVSKYSLVFSDRSLCRHDVSRRWLPKRYLWGRKKKRNGFHCWKQGCVMQKVQYLLMMCLVTFASARIYWLLWLDAIMMLLYVEDESDIEMKFSKIDENRWSKGKAWREKGLGIDGSREALIATLIENSWHQIRRYYYFNPI